MPCSTAKKLRTREVKGLAGSYHGRGRAEFQPHIYVQFPLEQLF